MSSRWFTKFDYIPLSDVGEDVLNSGKQTML